LPVSIRRPSKFVAWKIVFIIVFDVQGKNYDIYNYMVLKKPQHFTALAFLYFMENIQNLLEYLLLLYDVLTE